jgi:hypothetical protein
LVRAATPTRWHSTRAQSTHSDDPDRKTALWPTGSAVDGAIAALYDAAVVPGVFRPMSFGFASNELLGLITHDELDEAASF